MTKENNVIDAKTKFRKKRNKYGLEYVDKLPPEYDIYDWAKKLGVDHMLVVGVNNDGKAKFFLTTAESNEELNMIIETQNMLIDLVQD